jgi:hypothetical protein
MLLEGGSLRPSKPEEKRDSRLAFIGRGLPKEREILCNWRLISF